MPDRDDTEAEQPDDPRLREPSGDEGMPAEFIDAPSNEPGSQQPPPPPQSD